MVDLAAGSVRTQSMLRAGRPLAWEGETLRVEIGGPMRSVLEHRRAEVEQLLRQAAGRKVALEVVAPERTETGEEPEPTADPVQVARDHPLVRQAMELFDGRVETAFFKKKS